MLFAEIAQTSAAVSGSRSRRAKIEQIATLLRRADRDEVPLVVAFLSGELRQRQIGVGYAALGGLLGEWPRSPGPAGAVASRPPAPPPGPVPGALTVTGVDSAFAAIGAVAGTGAQSRRRELLAGLFARAGAGEREFLIRLLAGELRQGAQEGVMIEAVARAAEVPPAQVRRAHLLGGSLPAVAQAALESQEAGGGGADPAAALASLRAFGLRVGRPLRPMLASSAATVAAALARLSPAALEWKIDGIRIQVHRDRREIGVFTRTLDDITGRVPEITEAALALDVRSAVLDGEAVALGPDGRPRPFQVTSSRAGSQADVTRQREQVPLTPFFFDLLHLDGRDLVDEPASERHALLTRIAPGALVIPRVVTGDREVAESFFADAVARGHEGVVVKSPAAPYAAGRRGGDWIKVKPRHTLDLVVLAAEWGHGRREGWLSNLHLGARDPATGGLVMLGKTFKGLTDKMLSWQTDRLLALADPPLRDGPSGGTGARRAPHAVVRVRPELVVEVAFDGVQASSRYPGGLALRFARVVRYREDKPAAQADTIDTLRSLWPMPSAGPGAADTGGR